MPPTCHLASRSPRRLELLRAVGVRPVPCPVDLDETPRPGEPAAAMAGRLAAEKGRAAIERLAPGASGWLLAADTIVVLDGDVLGKPADADEACAMLRRLSGREHEVLTGVFAATVGAGGRSTGEVRGTRVRFRRLDEATIEAYVAGGEPMDKAGAYGIQARGSLLVESIDGSWTNVAGLPVERLPVWLRALGLDPLAVVGWRAVQSPSDS